MNPYTNIFLLGVLGMIVKVEAQMVGSNLFPLAIVFSQSISPALLQYIYYTDNTYVTSPRRRHNNYQLHDNYDIEQYNDREIETIAHNGNVNQQVQSEKSFADASNNATERQIKNVHSQRRRNNSYTKPYDNYLQSPKQYDGNNAYNSNRNEVKSRANIDASHNKTDGKNLKVRYHQRNRPKSQSPDELQASESVASLAALNREIVTNSQRLQASLSGEPLVFYQNEMNSYPGESYFINNRRDLNTAVGNNGQVQPVQPSSVKQMPEPMDTRRKVTTQQLQQQNQYSKQNSTEFQQITKFGFKMLKIASKSQGINVAISPFSIASVLALVQQGSMGKSQTQITMALDIPPALAATAFRNFNSILQKRSSRNILKSATNLFIENSFILNQIFQMNAVHNFHSDITPLSFRNPQFAAQQINQWVALNTQDQIKKLITPDVLDTNTQLVLANAIFFKGLWQTPFNPEATAPRQFQLATGAIKNILFMRTRYFYQSAVDESANLKFLIMPFVDNQYSLMLLLPLPGHSLNSVIDRLVHIPLAGYHKMPKVEVELEVPKFTVRADIDLAPILQEMGIRDIFTQDSGLANIGSSYRGLTPQITSALHTAMLSIDEQGGTAAGATAFAAVALSYDEADVVFQVNKPFLAIVWDNELQLPLFIVRVEDPTL